MQYLKMINYDIAIQQLAIFINQQQDLIFYTYKIITTEQYGICKCAVHGSNHHLKKNE